MDTPNTYKKKNKTGCCPEPNIKDWNKKEIEFKNRHFIRMFTKNFLYIPLNMSKVMTELNEIVGQSGLGMPPEQTMILSHDISPWKAEHLYSVLKPIKGADNVEISGTFLTLVFEGPYNNAGKWNRALIDYAQEMGYKPKKVYFFYTTCPDCADYYGKNYIIGLVKVAK